MVEEKYYVYLHIKETNGSPFYVGKGKSYRCFKTQGRSTYWNNVVNKYGYDIILLEEGLTEEEAFEKETYWINRIGRKDLNEGTLVNHSDGGEGKKRSEETRKKIGESKKRKVIDTDTGIIYNSIKEAAKVKNINRSTLVNYLSGHRKNKTSLKYK